MNEIILNGITVDEFIERISKLIDSKQNQNSIKLAEPEKKLFSRKEVCALFKVSYPTLRNWAKSGILRPKKIGRRVLYQLQDIEATIAKKDT